jgi:hypothetical protein
MLRILLHSLLPLALFVCIPARCRVAAELAGLLQSPPLPIIGNKRIALQVPSGWKIIALPGESWDHSSYDFDLATIARHPADEKVSVEILMHPIGRARRHGDLEGTPFRTTSGLQGILHHQKYTSNNDSWYLTIPYVKTEGAIIVRAIFSSGSMKSHRTFVETLFQSVRFVRPTRRHHKGMRS